MIAHRGTLFGGGRARASILLWVIFFPTLLVVYLVLNWLPTLVEAKGFKADASLASVLFNVFAGDGRCASGRWWTGSGCAGRSRWAFSR